MHWIILAACSALFLGVYDYFKKCSVNQNAVLPVLFFANLVGALIWTPVLLWAPELRSSWLPNGLIPEPLEFTEHAYIFAKSALVSCAWMLSYFALKALPLSIAAPIRATSPVWTLMIAIGVLGESPTSTQLIGITLTLGAFWYFSSGKRDGLEKEHDPRWILAMVGATLINACSGIYDKFLLQHLKLSPATVQAWFSIYLAVIVLPFYLGWLASLWNRRSSFRWKWSIPMIAISLLCADFIYFTAMHQPGALVSVITPIRRCSVIISFLIGILILKESSSRRKILGLVGILTGVTIIFLGN